MHWHAYTWTGDGEEQERQDERRLDSPEFLSSPLPPMRTGDWLAKPSSRIVATFDEVEPAVGWLAAQYAKLSAALPHPNGVGLRTRLENASEVLPRGVDVQWGEWLSGGRFTAVAMICCPNRHTDHPCPVRRPGVRH
ncbi:hypothetical protein ABT294_23705 [Nonomuraea sp. NPDC000554]|uniref:hypothetical protein n=1 Tax=Nonomuraea sp. NPDC000554 TaxID=3154259 RepID=UPI003328D237